jgi:hypothetical protein
VKKYIECFDKFQEKIMEQWCEQHDLTLIPKIYTPGDGSTSTWAYGIWFCDRRISLIQTDDENWSWDFSILFSQSKRKRILDKVEWLQIREASYKKDRERDREKFMSQYQGN